MPGHKMWPAIFSTVQAIVWLIYFGLIVRDKEVTISEPNPFILVGEIVMFTAVAVYGVWWIIKFGRYRQ